MMNKTLLCAIFSSLFVITVKSRVEFNNAICIGIDRSVLDFDQCILKAVNRTYKYFSLRAKFPRREPYNNISLTFALLRKANGYKPFLYNFTIDVCKYLTKRSNPVVRYFHNWFENYSTLNRTCPYGTQDEVIEKLPVDYVNHIATEVLPVPNGEYVFHTVWYFFNKKMGIVKLFFRIL